MAWTQSPGTDVYYEDQALTRTVPTTDATEGAPLKDAHAFTVVIEANSTKTLSGAGSLDAYVYDDTVAAWIPCPELTINVVTSSVRRASYNFVVAGSRPLSRVQFAANSITVSGGTTVRVYILVSTASR